MKNRIFLVAVLLLVAAARADDIEDVTEYPYDSLLMLHEIYDLGQTAKPQLPPVKSSRTAYAWALGGTLVPTLAGAAIRGTGNPDTEVFGTALLLSGLLIGPSSGQFYADDPGAAWVGIGWRTVGAILGMAIVLNITGPCDEDCGEAALLLYVPWGTGVAFSFFHTGLAVDRANEKARARSGSRMSLLPAVLPVSDSRHVTRWAPGLAFNSVF